MQASGKNTIGVLLAKRLGYSFVDVDIVIQERSGRLLKEIIARDNEISVLRKEDVSKAYFNCHTDITIPYRELDEIYGVTAEGEKLPVIFGGRFVAPGSEMLNRALEECESM